jgi:hypothetical protein
MIAQEYLQAANGLVTLAAANMATGLMAGDASKFKAGYTLDNAMIAVTEVFELGPDEQRTVRRILEQGGAK